MLLSLRSLWESQAPSDTCGHLLTEDGNFIVTESGNRIVTECFVIPQPAPPGQEVVILGAVILGGGLPVYSPPHRKKKAPWPGEELEEEELEELLMAMGVQL